MYYSYPVQLLHYDVSIEGERIMMNKCKSVLEVKTNLPFVN
jgi:hypothetical protein